MHDWHAWFTPASYSAPSNLTASVTWKYCAGLWLSQGCHQLSGQHCTSGSRACRRWGAKRPRCRWCPLRVEVSRSQTAIDPKLPFAENSCRYKQIPVPSSSYLTLPAWGFGQRPCIGIGGMPIIGVDRYRGYPMGHIAANKDDLLKRVKRIAGQIQAVERALESDHDCAKTLHLVAATRGAINGLMEEIIEDHAREHVANPALSEEERSKGVEELLEAIRRYSK